MSSSNETNKSRGSKLEIGIILTIGILTSLLIIQFTGPYLAKLPSNPYKGDAEFGLTFGYFQAGILEVLIAFMLIMCHDFGSTSLNKYFVMLFAGLILLFATINAMMEDLAPHIQTLSSSYAKLQEASFKMEEAERQIKYMSTLGINKNPTNSVLTNREITALKKSAFALQREASENLPWLEVLHNLLMKLILVFANAFIFWKAGSKIYSNSSTKQIIATDCNGVATHCNEEPNIATGEDLVATKSEQIAMEEDTVATEKIDELTSQVEDLQQQLETSNSDLQEKQEELAQEKETSQSKLIDFQEAKSSLETLKSEKQKITEELEKSKQFDARQLNKDFYESFMQRHGLKNLSELAQKISDATNKRTDNTDLSKASKAAWILHNMNLIDQAA